MPQSPYSNRSVEKFWGLIEYKWQWALTIRGWAILLFFLAAIGLLILTQIQPFLSVSAPIEAEALVLEGWVGDEVIKGAIAEFERGNYQLLITTGVPLSRGYYLSQYKDHAHLAAATVIALGFAPDKIVAVPAPLVKRNRTNISAVALQKWLSQSNSSLKSINLYSLDVHTRRSWLMFKQVLAPKVKVGAIAHPTSDYDPKLWWTYSAGVRAIISEMLAYLYARLTGTF